MRYFSFMFIIPYIAFLVNKFSILFSSTSFAKVNATPPLHLVLQISALHLPLQTIMVSSKAGHRMVKFHSMACFV